MAHDHEVPGILDVWRDLSLEQRQVVATAFWDDADSVSQQVEAIHAIAKQFKFRPQSILKLPIERRARQLAGMAKIPETVVGRALVAYHLAEKRPLLAAFLDALGIRHEQGVIEETLSDAPAEDRLAAAVASIAGAFPADDVRLYLRTLAAQDPDIWRGLAALAPAPQS